MKFSTCIAMIFALLSIGAPSAFAQNVPPGSYQRSCTGIDVDWHRLSATCRKRNGGWNFSVLEDYRRCNGDIVNNNGHLECDDDRGDDDDRDGYNDTPRGSYQQSCRNIDTDGRTLQAECRDRNGRWRYTELDDYRRCRGDIANYDGVLQCRSNDDDDQGGYGELPGGSWRASCRNYRLNGSVLYAECRTRYGNFVQSTIDIRRCRGDITNNDGQLTCGYGGYNGQGYSRITIYKHTNFGGKSRSYSTDVPDLNYDAFGNIASSAVVQGGVWQLCDRPNYKGFCIVIDRTTSNFNVFGFNDRAESIRRLR